MQAGLPIAPIDRIRLWSGDVWEDFILEWATSLASEYARVERCGGAGDMGRDVIGFVGDTEDWDNYQCKHYAAGLTPSEIWIELGKLVYYTWRGEYSVPRRYIFVSPHGAGTKLSNLLRDPVKLRGELVANWARYCSSGITSSATISLEGDLLDHLNELDFGIFDSMPPLSLLEQHATTPFHASRFGGGLPTRPDVEVPPDEVQEMEAPYVGALWHAYAEHTKCEVKGLADLGEREDLADHFTDSRFEFFSAEALRAFSRDALPEGEFERLQEEVHLGIKPELRASHPGGYERLLAAVRMANVLPLTNHPLVTRVSVRDRGGICHQLVNEGHFTWVRS